MKYDRFEQLPAWQTGIELARRVYQLSKQPPLRRERSLRDQIERAAVSVSNNIAEGFERGTTQELLTFLYIARGSAGEVRSMLCLFESLFEPLPEFADLKSEISNLKSLAESISRQLRGWAESLHNSKVTGQRYLTGKTRRTGQARKDARNFSKNWPGCAARTPSAIPETFNLRPQAAHGRVNFEVPNAGLFREPR